MNPKAIWKTTVVVLAGFFWLSCLENPQDLSGRSASVEWEEQCGDTPIVVEYDGCLLPDDPNQVQRWSLDSQSNEEPYIQGCTLVMPVDSSGGHIGYFRHDDLFSMSDGYSIDARIKVESPTPWTTRFRTAFSVSDDAKQAFIHLVSDNGSSYVYTADQSGTVTKEIDFSEFHEYRIEVLKTGKARFLVDGVQFHEVDYSLLLDAVDQPTIALFSGEESISYWDHVKYENCSVLSVDDAHDFVDDIQPPIEEQIDNLIQVVDEQMDAKKSVKNWMKKQLESVKRLDSADEIAKKLHLINEHFLQMKYSGVVTEDNAVVEAFLDMATMSQNIDIAMEGFNKDIIDFASFELVQPGLFYPGGSDLRFRVSTEFTPHGLHVSNSGKRDYAVLYRMSILNTATLEHVKTIYVVDDVPDQLPKDTLFVTDQIEMAWDGVKADGTMVEPGDTLSYSISAEYVAYDAFTHELLFFGDRVPMMASGPIYSMVTSGDDCEGEIVLFCVTLRGKMICCAVFIQVCGDDSFILMDCD